MITHRGHHLTTSLWMTCLLCLFLLTFTPVSSAQQLTAADVPNIVKTLKDKNPQVRIEAVRQLGKIGPEARAAIPALIETLSDEVDFVRDSAALAFGSTGRNSAADVPALVKQLQDRDAQVRAVAAG